MEARCPLGCGSVVHVEELKSHVEEFCKKRNVPCSRCGEVLWAEEVEEHLASLCAERFIDCCRGCGIQFPASQEPRHLAEECELRVVRCACGEECPALEKSFHDSALCELRSALCPQGCGLRVRRMEMEEHIRSKCANKHLYYESISTLMNYALRNLCVGLCGCPLGCGKVMKVKEVVAHIASLCGKNCFFF